MGGFTGLLDMVVCSDGPIVYSGMAKVRRSGDHLGAGVPKLSRIVSEISYSTFPTDGANCSLLNS